MTTPNPNPPGAYLPDAAKAPWIDATELVSRPLVTPPALVEGLIRRGERAVIGGASKSFKSWAALDLALSVSHGVPWLGNETEAGSALVVNLELPEWCIRQRLEAVASARGISLIPGALGIWTVRGESRQTESVLDAITTHGNGLALVVIDPAYKLFSGKDENAAGDVAAFLSSFDRITSGLGAAVVLPTHFAKGNAAGKEAMDRISGSGVFARDPDTIITLTRHEVDDAFTAEATLRTFPPAAPFVIRWAYPTFRRDDSLDPARLRQASGRTRKYDDQDLLGLLSGGPRTYSEWKALAEDELGMSKRTFDDYRQRLTKSGKAIKSSTTDAYYLPGRSPSRDGHAAR